MNYKTFIIINLILLIIQLIISTERVQKPGASSKTVQVGKETSLEVINKYGTIQITSWKKDSAYIRAEVKAYGSNQEKLNKDV